MAMVKEKKKQTTKRITNKRNIFLQYKAYEKLKKLAKNPPDLTRSDVLSAKRIRAYKAQGAGFSFLFGTERVDEKILQALNELAIESDCVEKMSRMQSGEIMNFIEGYPSENRQVLHTALRDFFSNPVKSEEGKEAAKEAKAEINKLKKFIQNIDGQKKFSDLIVISMGGSELGPEATFTALKHLQKKGRRVFFIGNVDPDNATAVLQEVNLAKTLVLVISKSGTTLETATNENFVRSAFLKKKLKPENHFVSITMPGSPMDNPSQYLEVFYLWDWVGGRYSTSSMVGGVMLAFACGFSVYWEFLRGANAMDKLALKDDMYSNLPLLGALLGIWNHNFLDCPTYAMIPYCQALARFPAHLQQVEMESNGKCIDQKGNPVRFSTGSVVFGEPGTNGQHSFYQLIHQGTQTVPLEMIGFKKSIYNNDMTWNGVTSQEKLLSNLFAQSIALAGGQKSRNPNKNFPGNRPSHILLAEQCTPYSLGALFSYFENKIAFQGFIWGINSFDQEGVQLGKVLANQMIDLFANRKKKKGKTNGNGFPLGNAFLSHLF